MSGLLRKDINMIWSECRVNLIVAVVFGVCGVFAKAMFWVIWPMFLGTMTAYSTLTLDEQSGWLEFADALPITRRTVVTEKYVLCLLLAGALSVLISGLYAVTGTGAELGLGFGTLLALCMVIGLLSPMLMLPVMFKWGSVKGRAAYLIALMGVGAIAGGLTGLTLDDGFQQGLSGASWTPAALAVMAVMAGLFALSWVLAVRFYEKRVL